MSTAIINEKPKNRADSLILKGTLLVASTLTVMAGASISPALPAIRQVFADIPNADLMVRLVLTLPALFIALVAPIAGAIIDKFGRKRLLIVSAIAYGFAGGAGYFINDIWLLLLSRALLGVAVAGVMTTVTTLIADYYTGQARSTFLGIQAAFSGLGGFVYLSLSGVLADIGWHSPFLIYFSAFLIVPFIVTVIYEPTLRKQASNKDAMPVTDVKFPLGLMAFVYSTMLITQIVFYAVPVQLPFYLESLVGANGAQSGLAIASLSLFFSIASASFGWFDKRFPNLYTMLLGFTITGTGFILLTLATGWIMLGFGLVASGFGLGLVVPNLITWLASGVPEILRGRALGGVTASLFFGQFVSPFIVTPISNLVGDGGIYAVLGIFLLTFVVIAFMARHAIAKLTNTPLEKE